MPALLTSQFFYLGKFVSGIPVPTRHIQDTECFVFKPNFSWYEDFARVSKMEVSTANHPIQIASVVEEASE